MKKFLFTLSLIFIISMVSIPAFAYSFTEFPILSTEDRYQGCNIIFRSNEGTFYYTSTSLPNFIINHEYNFFTIEPSTDYKMYILSPDSSSWELYDINLHYYDFFPSSMVDNTIFLCSDVLIITSFEIVNDEFFMWSFTPNSTIPFTNWQQLQYQEQQKINQKLQDTNKTNFYFFGILFGAIMSVVFATSFKLGV